MQNCYFCGDYWIKFTLKWKKKILGAKRIKKSFVISTQISSRGLLALQASFVYIFQSKKKQVRKIAETLKQV